MIRDPNLALASVFFGLLLAYVEFLRPGWIIPGVAGATLAMLGLAGLWEQSFSGRGLVLLVAALALAAADAWLRWGGVGAIVAAALGAYGVAILIAPPARVHWSLSLLALCFVIVTWRLLQYAVQARINKMVP